MKITILDTKCMRILVSGCLLALAGCNAVPQTPGSATAEQLSATATFTHAGLTSTCIGCHLADRPNGVIHSYVHTYSKHGQDDCVECHAAPAGTNPSSAAWAGAYHQHSPFAGIQCATCHVYDRPSMAYYPDGTTVSGHFDSFDCVSCHLPQLTTAYVPFVFSHQDVFGNSIKTCLPCHQQQGVAQHGAAIGDCAQCHSRFGDWTGASATPTATPTPLPPINLSPTPSASPSPAPSTSTGAPQ